MKEKSNLVRIFSGTEITVNILKGQLENSAISCIIQNEYQSGITAGFSGGGTSAVDLFIRESDLKKAGPIIQEFRMVNKK